MNVKEEKRLRKKYRIQKGDILRIRADIREDVAFEKITTKPVRVKVEGIYPHIIAVRYPWGQVESFDWNEFEQRRMK